MLMELRLRDAVPSAFVQHLFSLHLTAIPQPASRENSSSGAELSVSL
jgi:hypothetical protein